MTRGQRRRGPAVLGLLAVGVAGCGADAPTQAEGAGDVELTEFTVDVRPEATEAGPFTFEVLNEGEQTHELLLIRTELPAAELPTTDDRVDEEAEDVDVVTEVEDIAAGSTDDLYAELEAGHYALICNLPGHYTQGMHADFDVE